MQYSVAVSLSVEGESPDEVLARVRTQLDGQGWGVSVSKPQPAFVRLLPGEELWAADPNCEHEIVYPSGGGIKCRKCRGWCCY